MVNPKGLRQLVEVFRQANPEAFIAINHRRSLSALPKYYHPWDPEAPIPVRGVSLDQMLPAAVDASKCLQSPQSDLALLVLAGAARAIIEELIIRARAADEMAAGQLWDLGCLTAEAIGGSDGAFLHNIQNTARAQSHMPAMVGLLTEDRSSLEALVEKVQLAKAPLVQKSPAKVKGKRGRRQGSIGYKTTPMNALAESVVEYIEGLRTLQIVQGDIVQELKRAGIPERLYDLIRNLKPLSKERQILTAWCAASEELIKLRYSDLSNLPKVNRLGFYRKDAGGGKGWADGAIDQAFRQAMRTIALP